MILINSPEKQNSLSLSRRVCEGDREIKRLHNVENTRCLTGTIESVRQISPGDGFQHISTTLAHLENQPTAGFGLTGLSADKLMALQAPLPAGQIGWGVEQLNHFRPGQLDHHADWVFHDKFP